MPRDITYLSKEGYEKLQKELEYLKEVKKPEISERLNVAASHGDLSENFEYDSAKEALTQVMLKIRDLSNKLATAEIINEDEIDSGKVYIGASVKLLDLETREEITYKIVGSYEADPLEDKISVDSPIARGLLGKSPGDTVEITVPRGTIKYQVLDIKR